MDYTSFICFIITVILLLVITFTNIYVLIYDKQVKNIGITNIIMCIVALLSIVLGMYYQYDTTNVNVDTHVVDSTYKKVHPPRANNLPPTYKKYDYSDTTVLTGPPPPIPDFSSFTNNPQPSTSTKYLGSGA